MDWLVLLLSESFVVFIVIKTVINKIMKHLFHLSRGRGGNKSLRAFFFWGGRGVFLILLRYSVHFEVFPGLFLIFYLVFRVFYKVFLVSFKVFRVIYKVFRVF